MNNITEIIQAYTSGDKTLEETNAALKGAGATVHLNPEKNAITAEELAYTRVGETPAEADGVGLLDTGTSTLDKVRVEDGRLVDVDCGEMYALCIIGGKTYHVKGAALED